MIINTVQSNVIHSDISQYAEQLEFTYNVRKFVKEMPKHNIKFAIIRHFDTGYYSLVFENNEFIHPNIYYTVILNDETLLDRHHLEEEKPILFHGNALKKPIEKLKKISIIISDDHGQVVKTVEISVSYNPENVDRKIYLRSGYRKLRIPYSYRFYINKDKDSFARHSSYTMDISVINFSNERPTSRSLNINSYYYWGIFWDARTLNYHLKIKADDLKIVESEYNDLSTFKVKPTHSSSTIHDLDEIKIRKTRFEFVDAFKFDLNERKVKLSDPIDGEKGIVINPVFIGDLLFSQKIEIEHLGKFEIIWKQRFEKSSKFPNKNKHFVSFKSKNLTEDFFYENRFSINSTEWINLIYRDQINNDYLEYKFLYRRREDDE